MAQYSVIIAAAGNGERFGKEHKKQFAKVDNRPLFIRAIECFVNREDVCQVILVIAPDDAEMVKQKYGANLGFMGVTLVEGGERRWQSVRNALSAVKEDAEYVAVHDAVRICPSTDMIDRVFAEAKASGAAILAAPVTATLKAVSAAGIIEKTVPRSGLYEAQTPQVFKKELLIAAYTALPEDSQATDDAEIVAASGHDVTAVQSDSSNLKITYPQDLMLATSIIKSRPKAKVSKFGAFEEAQW